jgi:hypothetical protein
VVTPISGTRRGAGFGPVPSDRCQRRAVDPLVNKVVTLVVAHVRYKADETGCLDDDEDGQDEE